MTVRQLRTETFDNTVAVVLTEGLARFHAGIAFRRHAGDLSILHLAAHHKVRATQDTERWAEAVCKIDQIEQSLVAAYCETLAVTRPRVPYALLPDGHFEDDGTFVAGVAGTGLTCATLVQYVFERLQVPLVDASTWQVRDSDDEAKGVLINYLVDQNADTAHIDAVRESVDCIRVRPEEVAVATTASARPVNFDWAAAEGERLAAVVEALELW